MYNASLVSTKQEALIAERRKYSKRKRNVFFLFIILLLVLFFILIRKPYFRINTVNVSGVTLVNNGEVKSFVENYISGYRFFLLPKNSIIFLDKEKLQYSISMKFPRLENIKISKGHNLNIEITEPIFESMYCNVIPLDLEIQKCYLLHQDGKIASVAPEFSYSPYFTIYKITGDVPYVGQNIITLEEINRIKQIKNKINSYNINTAGYVYGSTYDEVLLDTGNSFKELPRVRILQNATDLDVDSVMGPAIKDKTVQKLLIENLNDLEYIDLRFNGQVVYKKKGEKEPQ